MLDLSLQLLIKQLNSHDQNSLLILDEQTSAADLNALRTTGIHCISQRIDQYTALTRQGFNCSLNDYDFKSLHPKQYDIVAHRLSKQKHIVNHILQHTRDLLHDNGTLLLAGAKNEGIKSYIKKIHPNATISRERTSQQNELYIIQIFALNKPLSSEGYHQLTQGPRYKNITFISKPGVYGWQKIDKGSELLAQSLSSTAINEHSRVLDLGCGYGFLTLITAQYKPKQLIATDSNIAAINCCKANIDATNIDAEVLLADCGEGIHGHFDVIVCNPPFHTGFDVDSDLTLQFLKRAQSLLNHTGTAFFVVNQFIGLPNKAKPYFKKCQLINDANGFHVYALSI